MDFLAAIRRETDRFYELAESADPDARVPSCPDWTVADLVRHLAEVHWFWGTDIETRATDPDAIENQAPTAPSRYTDLVVWGRTQADRMLGLLEATGDDVRVWTWGLADHDQNVGFVRRHQVQEAAVHRWDLEGAVSGSPAPIDAAEAADGIDEMLAVTIPWCVSEDKPLTGTVHLHCTDVEGEWFLHTDGRVERIHAKGDVAMRGAASDLLLALYKRIPLDRIDVIGDAALAETFVGRIGTE
jgi:uncharacterized protein (TIGR03083 family)